MKRVMILGVASALAANALALTTNVSTVAELEAALVYMNEGGTYAKAGNVVQLAAGSYDVTGLDVQYWHSTGGTLTNSNAHLGISRFTLKGATDNPRDTVIYVTDNTRILFSYVGVVCDLTLSNAVNTADGGSVGNVNGSSVYTNVLVTCCQAKNGGASASGTWRGCTFVGNRATVCGGALYGSKTIAEGCRFEDNEAYSYGGGTYATQSSGCTYVGNQAIRGGGAYNTTLTNCLLYANRAVDYGGGVFGVAVSSALTVDCVVSNNWAGYSGGGVYCGSNVASRICMNTVEGYQEDKYATGGGVGGVAFVTNCLVDGNAVYGIATNYMGGGVYASTAVGCLICNNYSRALGASAANSLLVGCVVSNNVSGNGSSSIRSMTGMRDCELYGTSIDLQSWMIGCRVTDYTNGNVIAVGANVYTNGWFPGPNRVFNTYCAVTNCLIARNNCYGLITSTKGHDSIFSNCTFADNRTEYLATSFDDASGSVLTVDNCLIAENTKQNGTGTCNLRTSYGNVKWSNTLVGSVDCSVNYKYPMSNMITNANPRFVGAAADPENPYALRHSSPARGKGAVYGWMSAATDIRGCPRLRDGLVDLGCYECWLDPVGALLLLR